MAIAAAQAGERAEARRLLTQVVEADETNEQAWLWLADAVDTTAERRICLENVLTLHPQHPYAQQALAVLSEAEGVAPADEIVVRKSYAPISPAAAVLFPERQVVEWRYRDPTLTRQAPAPAIVSCAQYADVWARETAVCPYCATEIDVDVSQCPTCARLLRQKRFRYPQPSANLHVLWVLLAGLGQLFLIQAFYVLLIERALVGTIGAGLLMVLFFALALGVYYRRVAAHLGTIVVPLVFCLSALLAPLLPIDFSALEVQLSGIDPAMANFLGAFAQGIGQFLRWLQVGMAVLIAGYAVFLTAPDFDQVEEQLVARLDKGLQYASDYHMAACAHAQAGRLATAVLHWQRAVAKEPHQWRYLRHLGIAYAQLGFYERSLDTLKTAQRLTTQDEGRTALPQLITAVQKRLTP